MLYQSCNPHGGDIYAETVDLDFSANTNPYGTPEGVQKALRNALGTLHHYPDPYCRKLIQAISDFEQVPRDFILCGNGAAELIYSYCMAIHAKKALELAPTFSEYALGLSETGCNVVTWPLKQEHGFQLTEDFLSGLLETSPDVVFLCNPNNPTGRCADPELLKTILSVTKERHIRLFVDECFLDLTEGIQSLKPYLTEYPNLFLLKAFTKSYGMAGVRLGYGLCADPDLLQAMSQTVQPWNVSTLAQEAGIAALKEQDFLNQTKEVIRRERAYLTEGLSEMGFFVCPSSTNYLLFQGPLDLHKALKPYRIAIRDCSNYTGLSKGWYRIAVRLHNENTQLLAAIRRIVEK